MSQAAAAFNTIRVILQDCVSGQISVNAAITKATDPAILSSLDDRTIEQILYNVQDLGDKNWRGAIKAQKVMHAVVDGGTSAPRPLRLRAIDIATQIRVTGRACLEAPDGRLFQPAIAAGEETATQCEREKLVAWAGQIYHYLGVVHLDPYLMGGTIGSDYSLRVAQWKQRLIDEYGGELAGVPPEQLALPEPKDAFVRAAQYFRRALPYRVKIDRAWTLKALAQSLRAAHALGVAEDENEILSSVAEALSLFDNAQEPRLYADLMLLRGDAAQPGATSDRDEMAATVERLRKEPLHETVQRYGAAQTAQLYSTLVNTEERVRPAVAFELWLKANPLFAALNNTDDRITFLNLGVRLMRSVFCHDSLPPSPAQPLLPVAQELLNQLNKGTITPEQAGEGLLALTALSLSYEQEGEGLAVFRALSDLGVNPGGSLGDLAKYLEASLHKNEGVNEYRSGKYASAVDHYLAAAHLFSTLRLPSVALMALSDVDKLVAGADPDTLASTVVGLMEHGLAIEAVSGRAGTETLKKLYGRILARAGASGKLSKPFLLALFQIAKGAAFARLVQQPPQYTVASDPRALELLEDAKRAARALERAPSDNKTKLLDKNTLLTAYALPDELSSGENADAALENAQHAFDARVNQMLLTAAAQSPLMPAIDDKFQAAIDDRTVLVNYFFGPSSDGIFVVYTTLITREDVIMTGCSTGLPSGDVFLEADGKKILGDYLTLSIGETRSAIEDDDQERMKRLSGTDMSLFLGGPLMAHLNKLREAGKDRLCIIPFGSSRFYPFHLLGELGSPLAASWKISYLPSLELLQRSPIDLEAKLALACFGVNWSADNALGLPALDNAADEATAIGQVSGVAPILNENATKQALLEALSSSGRIHVATHGFHNVAAPSFQALYMHPEGQDSGAIFAYDLLSLDLRNLDLITLSACETALGRFDRLENFRGLPAVLLMRGARTMVGTLWSVETNCAQYFFSVLYEQLEAKKTKLDAFCSAQNLTRSYYPSYRDWGAFYLMGDC